MELIKYAIALLIITVMFGPISAQKYFTKSGEISFYSDGELEKIEAKNDRAACVLDLEKGSIEFAVLIKGFQFDKALMQEHFNENYMESDKFPKAIFKGKIKNIEEIKIEKFGEYQVQVVGELTLHGVMKAIEISGTFVIGQGEIAGTTKFIVKCSAYNIDIPGVVAKNIKDEIEVTVKIGLQPVQ